MKYLLAFLAALPWAVAAFAHHQHHGQVIDVFSHQAMRVTMEGPFGRADDVVTVYLACVGPLPPEATPEAVQQATDNVRGVVMGEAVTLDVVRPAEHQGGVWAVVRLEGQAGSINRRVLNLGVPMLAETAAERAFCGGLQ